MLHVAALEAEVVGVREQSSKSDRFIERIFYLNRFHLESIKFDRDYLRN